MTHGRVRTTVPVCNKWSYKLVPKKNESNFLFQPISFVGCICFQQLMRRRRRSENDFGVTHVHVEHARWVWVCCFALGFFFYMNSIFNNKTVSLRFELVELQFSVQPTARNTTRICFRWLMLLITCPANQIVILAMVNYLVVCLN